MVEDYSFCSHLGPLVRIFYYRAPLNEWPIPREIPPDLEEIELIVKGHVYFEAEGAEKKLSCGHIVWHLSGEKTVYKSDLNDPYECLVIKFSVKQGISKRPAKLSYWADSEECRCFVEEVLTASKQKQNLLLLRDYAYTRLYWHAIHSLQQNGQADHITLQQQENLSSPIQRVRDHIQHLFYQPLTIKELSDVADLSESHLYLRFKQELGKTPHQYLLGRRMEEARHLLEHSELSIKAITYQCGFHDSASFCRSFKAHFRTTPLQFRQEGESTEVSSAQ